MIILGKLPVSYNYLIDMLREYAILKFSGSRYPHSDIPSPIKTFHEFEATLPENLRDCTDEINRYICNFMSDEIDWEIQKECFYFGTNMSVIEPNCIEPICDMNELYVTSIGSGGSDAVFEREHLDGPFFALPYSNIFRCMVGIQGNSNISTFFPEENREIVINTNTFMAFDYNNDVHCIRHNTLALVDISPRILLKLHYIVYPSFLPKSVVFIYKKLHIYYNGFMRRLFLMSQSSKSKPSTFEGLLALVINTGTTAYCFLYKKIFN